MNLLTGTLRKYKENHQNMIPTFIITNSENFVDKNQHEIINSEIYKLLTYFSEYEKYNNLRILFISKYDYVIIPLYHIFRNGMIII